MKFKEGHIYFGKLEVSLLVSFKGSKQGMLYYDYKKMADVVNHYRDQGIEVQASIGRSFLEQDSEEHEKECEEFLTKVKQYFNEHLSKAA